MGASNFHNVNAHNIYAVLMDYESPVLDEDGNETEDVETCSVDLSDIHDFIHWIKEDAQELAPALGISYHDVCDKDPHSLRSYPSTDLFQFYARKSFSDIEINVNINCVMRSAYYEGACLDYHFTYTVHGSILDEIDFIENFEWDSNLPLGMIKIQCKHAEKWALKTTAYLTEVAEEFFKKKSMPLIVTAKFSNGETHYAKI
jgi:hypothetical protein